MSPVTEWNQQQILAEMSGKVLNGMDQACSFAADQARGKAPRLTGKTAELVDYEVVPVGNDIEGRVGVSKGADSGARSNQGQAFYWKFHELGSKHQPARPFIRPAITENAAEITRLIAEG